MYENIISYYCIYPLILSFCSLKYGNKRRLVLFNSARGAFSNRKRVFFDIFNEEF